MGNNNSNNPQNPNQKAQTPSQINTFRQNLKHQITTKCHQLAINSQISYNRYNDILSIFEDYGLINLRKTPISKKMYDKLDFSRQNSVSVQNMITHLEHIVNMDKETAIHCKLKRFFFIA